MGAICFTPPEARTVEKNFVVGGQGWHKALVVGSVGGMGGWRPPNLLGGFAERGSFGWASIKVLSLLVVCLQHVTQGFEMLGIGFCLDRCHSKICPPPMLQVVFWLRKALYGQSQSAPPWKVGERRGPFWQPDRRAPAKGGGVWKRGSPLPSPPRRHLFILSPTPMTVVGCFLLFFFFP